MPHLAQTGAAVLSGVLFALAFPPVPLILPVFVCLTPMAVGVAREADGRGRLRSAMRIGFWFGCIGYGLNLYWIATSLSRLTKLAIIAFAATVLIHAMILGGIAAALFAARRATRWPLAALLPASWISWEVIVGHLGDIAFPWLPLGLGVAEYPLFIQIADLSGVHGVSFWIAFTNGAIADAYLHRASRRAMAVRLLPAAAVVLVVAAYGQWRLVSTPVSRVAAVAIVQPNIPEDQKLRREHPEVFVQIHSALSRELLTKEQPDLIVWPETALPGFIQFNRVWVDSLTELTTSSHTPVLFGVVDMQRKSRSRYDYFNAARVMDPDRGLRRHPVYRKIYLVPVVERVPFLNPEWFGDIQYFGGFGRGAEVIPFDLGFASIGVLICYESIFPQLARDYRRKGASLLVNITNDAWFGRSLAPYQHYAHLALRAVENRVGIVRAANTGISGYIDALGRDHGATKLFTRTTRSYAVEVSAVRTLYVRAGDWVGMVSLAATVALLGLYLMRRRGRSSAPP